MVRGVVVALVREQLKDGPKSAAIMAAAGFAHTRRLAAAEAAEISEIALIAAACVRNRRQHRPLPRRRHDNY